jgi:hypothetical protein
MTQQMPLPPDSEVLLRRILRSAKEHLRIYGGFNPFGAMMTSDGQVEFFQVVDTGPVSEWDMAEGLVHLFRKEAAADRLRVAGICANGVLTTPDGERDVVTVTVERPDGVALLVITPYSKRRFRGTRFDNFTTESVTPWIFGSDANP